MPTYLLNIEAIPTSAATTAADVASASVLVFVIADSRESAESMARSHILDFAWIAKGISLFLEPSDEQLSNLDADIYSVYQQSVANGIASMFVAYPSEQRDQDAPIEIRSLGGPIINAENKN